MTEPFDPEALRQAASAQMRSRMPAHTAWILAFENAVREALTPRVQLFLQIMAHADSPCLTPTTLLLGGPYTGRPFRDYGDPNWGWTIYPANQWVTVEDDLNGYYGAKMDVTHTGILVCSPEFDGFQLADAHMGLPAFRVMTPLLPQQSVVVSGEITQPSALATAAIYMINQNPETPQSDSSAAAHQFVQACDNRMLAILAAHGMTFPDRSLTDAVWDDETVAAMSVITDQRKAQQRLAARRPMTLDQIALWLRGQLPHDDEYVVPEITANELAQVLALARVKTEQRKPTGAFARWKDPVCHGWLLSRVEGPDPHSERTIRSHTSTYVRPDGTAFDEHLPEGGGYDRLVITEHDPNRLYSESDLVRLRFSLTHYNDR